MGLKKVYEVKVGSIVRVKGDDYKVVRNPITNLVLNKKVGIAYDEREVSLNTLLESVNHGMYVEVVSEPKADLTSQLRGQLSDGVVAPSSSSLTEQLRKQKAQQDLTENLRAQVEDEDDEEECDCPDCTGEYDDDDDFEDEEEEAATKEDFGWGRYYQPTTTPVAKAEVSTANLRSQAAQGIANQARFEASIAKAKATAAITQSDIAVDVAAEASEMAESAHDRLDAHADAHNRLADAFEKQSFHQAVTEDAVSQSISSVSHQVENVSIRVNALEAKQKEEERKMDLQRQLDSKLAAKKAQADVQSQLNAKLTQKTGGNGMKNILGAFKAQFGKVEGVFAFSPITGGLALRKGISADFVAYDAKSKSLTDVSGLTLKFDVPAFKLPTAEKDVKVGDIIIHNAAYVYVTKKADGYLETIDPVKAVRGSVIPTKNAILGAAFYTVVKTLDAAGEGGFNPMLLMAMKDGKKDDILPFLLMSGGLGGAAKQGQIDPTMLMMLGDSTDELLPLILMQQGGVVGEGFNPLMMLAMEKGGKFGDLLPLLMMQQGGQAGAINPMMLMAMGDGGSDMKDLFMMQALTGQNIFGGVAPKADTPNSDK